MTLLRGKIRVRFRDESFRESVERYYVADMHFDLCEGIDFTDIRI